MHLVRLSPALAGVGVALGLAGLRDGGVTVVVTAALAVVAIVLAEGVVTVLRRRFAHVPIRTVGAP